MRWTERQQSMLRAMGVALWQAPAGSDASLGAGVGAGVGDGVGDSTAVADIAVPAAPFALPAEVRPPPQTMVVQAESMIASMGWAELRDAVRGCTACGLCQSRQQTVFGVGHERAHWMIVGEAPGEQEDRQGEPFVGAAGRLLDRMLLALGLTRQDGGDAAQRAYIANTLKCRPPGNRNPTPQELAQCLPFLERQLMLVQPRLILAMGRFAVQALLGSQEPIGRLRGRVHTWQGRPVVVTYHPAYLLRQPSEKARAWADLCLACDTLDAAGCATP